MSSHIKEEPIWVTINTLVSKEIIVLINELGDLTKKDTKASEKKMVEILHLALMKAVCDEALTKMKAKV